MHHVQWLCIDKTTPYKYAVFLSDIKSLHVIYEYQLSARQLTQQMVGEYLTFFQN